MKKRAVKSILRKIETWKTAEMSTGLYRLFTYLTWEEIPEKYKKFFSEEAKKLWLEVGASDTDGIAEDTDMMINNILLELSKGNITLTFPLIPPLLADLFVLGRGTDRLQAAYMTIIRDYLEVRKFDVQLASIEAALKISNLIDKIVKAMGVEVSINISETMDNILAAGVFELADKPNSNMGGTVMADIDKALEEYEKRKSQEVS